METTRKGFVPITEVNASSATVPIIGKKEHAIEEGGVWHRTLDEQLYHLLVQSLMLRL